MMPTSSEFLYSPCITFWSKWLPALQGSSLSLGSPGTHDTLQVCWIKVFPARPVHHRVVVVSFELTLQKMTKWSYGRGMDWVFCGVSLWCRKVSLCCVNTSTGIGGSVLRSTYPGDRPLGFKSSSAIYLLYNIRKATNLSLCLVSYL